MKSQVSKFSLQLFSPTLELKIILSWLNQLKKQEQNRKILKALKGFYWAEANLPLNDGDRQQIIQDNLRDLKTYQMTLEQYHQNEKVITSSSFRKNLTVTDLKDFNYRYDYRINNPYSVILDYLKAQDHRVEQFTNAIYNYYGYVACLEINEGRSQQLSEKIYQQNQQVIQEKIEDLNQLLFLSVQAQPPHQLSNLQVSKLSESSDPTDPSLQSQEDEEEAFLRSFENIQIDFPITNLREQN